MHTKMRAIEYNLDLLVKTLATCQELAKELREPRMIYRRKRTLLYTSEQLEEILEACRDLLKEIREREE